jgi:hypothetical protein
VSLRILKKKSASGGAKPVFEMKAKYSKLDRIVSAKM